jgi:uncharacterized protein YggL (DUF469 family)
MRKRLRKKLGLKEFTNFAFYIYITLKDEFNTKEYLEVVLEYLITFCEKYGLCTGGAASIRRNNEQYNIKHFITGDKCYYIMNWRQIFLCIELEKIEAVEKVVCSEITRLGSLG